MQKTINYLEANDRSTVLGFVIKMIEAAFAVLQNRGGDTINPIGYMVLDDLREVLENDRDYIRPQSDAIRGCEVLYKGGSVECGSIPALIYELTHQAASVILHWENKERAAGHLEQALVCATVLWARDFAERQIDGLNNDYIAGKFDPTGFYRFARDYWDKLSPYTYPVFGGYDDTVAKQYKPSTIDDIPF